MSDSSLALAVNRRHCPEKWREQETPLATEARHEPVIVRRGRGVRGRPSQGWASLSPTESDVVHLVGRGHTNKEIGDRLSISHRTVQGYLSRVFSKLGLRSRREIRIALHDLSVPHPGSRNRPFLDRTSLSPIEREIVDLVGDGLTNREIGDRLFLSHRTVHGHLSRAFPKLGVRSRREIRLARSAGPLSA